MKKRILLIYNPNSGKRIMEENIVSIINFFSRNNVFLTLYPTLKKGDGGEVVASLKEGDFDSVIASGGDGTVSEIAEALHSLEFPLPLSIIPTGSTNDVAHSLDIPFSIMDASSVALNGRVVEKDVGLFNETKKFLYVAAFGVFTDVTYKTKQSLKNYLGYAAYILEGAKSIFNIPIYLLNIESEEKTIEGEFVAGIISTSFYVGGFPTVESNISDLSDGLFEVLLIKKPKTISGYSTLLSSLLSGTLDEENMVFFSTSRVTISGEALEWNLDGESGGRKESVQITVSEKKIKMISGESEDFSIHL